MDLWLLGFFVGVAAGFVITLWRIRQSKKFNKTPVGTLRIDTSDPTDGPYLFLELAPGSDPLTFKNGDTILFLISTENYLSQD